MNKLAEEDFKYVVFDTGRYRLLNCMKEKLFNFCLESIFDVVLEVMQNQGL